MTPAKKYTSVDEYIADMPDRTREILERLRKAIHQAAPEAEEVISYNMPALRFHGILLYYAAHAEHIGFYPGNATLIRVFEKELAGYETSKGTIRFPLSRPLPVALVKKIVKKRVQENLSRDESRTRPKR
jgi:uncharacterized protein YdhG (YjbR/CyaY superfamily)